MAKQINSYEDSIAEIEKIIHNLENGNISIDVLTEEIKRAMTLITNCKNKLQATEKEIVDVINIKA